MKHTPEQTAIIDAPDQPTLVLAGAGSGKTATVSARMRRAPRSSGVLGLTFTRKAAGELAERAPQGATVSTYDAFVSMVLTDDESSPVLAGPAAVWLLARRVVTSWTGELPVTGAVRSVVSAVVALHEQMLTHDVSPAEVRAEIDSTTVSLTDAKAAGRQKAPYADTAKVVASLAERAALLPLVDELRAAMARAEVSSYADRTAAAIARVRRDPELVARLRARFTHVFLDEYQDTSVAQVRLLSAIFAGHPVTAVGDPMQSIYAWRGAGAGTLDRFHDDFGAGQTLALTTSWRSGGKVIAAAGRVAGEAGLDLQPAPGREDDGEVHALFAADMPSEAAQVAQAIAERWEPGQGRTAAVLCRRRAQAPILAEALTAAGVPNVVLGGQSVLGQPAVGDVRALLALAAQGHAPSLVRLMVRTGVPITALAQVHDRDLPICLTIAGHESFEQISAWSDEVAGALDVSLGEALRVAARCVGAADEEVEPFFEMAGALPETIGLSAGSFLEWCQAMEDEERGGEMPVDDAGASDAVVEILTVHGAKGLEWDVVAVPGLVERQFPSYTSAVREDGSVSASAWLTAKSELPYALRGDAGALPTLSIPAEPTHADVRAAIEAFKVAAGEHKVAEERRLAYVALTRARDHLIIAGSELREGATALPPSRFYTEAVA